MSKAHDYPQIYKDLGYDLSKLGCIMLDLEPLEVKVPANELYYAKNKDRFWIDGLVAAKTPHVTLLYGLLRSGLEMQKHVDTVLEGIKLSDAEIDHVGYFESPYDDEPYYCVVAHLKITKELTEANERLKFLPHINTFPGYKAHFTLAYINKNERRRNAIVGALNAELSGKRIKAGGINYGGDK
jgi:hypothetical protein